MTAEVVPTSSSRFLIPARSDPRWIFAGFLGTYTLLGHAYLNFTRAPEEIMVAVLTCCGLDMLYTFVSSRKVLFPLSALISALGLAILFTAPGNGWLMLLVSWITITAKYLLTWRGHHIFNPTNFALVLMLLFSGGHASIAPAYQWGGTWEVPVLVIVLGLIIMSRVRKLPLVLSFWLVYGLGALLRAQLTHMPVEITLWATVSGGAFMLFSFFMITDPKTSPSTRRGQIWFGVGIGLVDLWLQLSFAVFSLFYALVLVCACRAALYIYRDVKAGRDELATIVEPPLQTA